MDTKIAEIAAFGLLMMFYILGGPEERAHTAGASLQANPTQNKAVVLIQLKGERQGS